jgi:hypothetical protein
MAAVIDGIRRERKRTDSLKLDRQEIAQRVIGFFTDVTQSRTGDIENRLQRYAKFRQWTEGRDWLGPETSDAAIPDMMTQSLGVQDTLHNAVMSVRPPVTAIPINEKDQGKKDKIDQLIDFQVFVEQKGEKMIEELTETFVNDGVFTAFIPWVKEDRVMVDFRIFGPIPQDRTPIDYFRSLLSEVFPQGNFRLKPRSDGWDFIVAEGDESFDAKFYTTDDDRVELLMERKIRVYDGPKVIIKDYEDVLTPPRSANLQIPGPSNPGGAPFVVLVDYPTRDEVKRLIKNGFYDLAESSEFEDNVTHVTTDGTNQELKTQKDDFSGKTADKKPRDLTHNTLTRLTCFDLFDINDDGIDEDVIFWVIKESQTLLKAKLLTEMYPVMPPRRPFAEASFLPVKGQREGIGLLEMMEGLHDLLKQLFDMTVDGGTISTVPFFFYRPTSSVRPEILRLFPGEGYPTPDPKNDVVFPQIQNNGMAFGLNMMSMVNQFTERLTKQGELQFGRVPAGKSSALRTVGGLQTILSQGEARPERILRRFFMGLTEIWAQIHELNKVYLPEKKKFRIMGFTQPGEDVYQEVTDRSELTGRFQFDFSANVLNSSKAGLQQSLDEMIATYVNPITLQTGILQPDGLYRLLRAKGKALGQNPDDYLSAPTPESTKPKLMMEEALSAIMQNQIPFGVPEEGATAHLQRIIEFIQTDQLGLLSQQQLTLLQGWMEEVQQLAKREQQLQQLAAAAGQRQAPTQAGPTPVDQSPPPVNENELIDETLPSA